MIDSSGGERPGERRSARLLGAALWRRLDLPALEQFRLWEDADAFRLEGRALLALEGQPAEAAYEVVCSRSWETRTARVRLERGAETRTVELRREDGDRWWVDGERRADLDGIADVDLGFTPSTNTLPIRRLSLGVGAGSDLRAAWVRFPELSVEVLEQRYVRTGPSSYRYESRGGSFEADLTADGLGVIVTYGDLWERVADA